MLHRTPFWNRRPETHTHRTDPQTHRLDCFLKFPELSGKVGVSRNPSKNTHRKITNLSGKSTLLLILFHEHSFTPYPSLSGQVEISSIHSKNADRKITDLSGKHSFTLLFSYTCCAWAGGTFFPIVLLCQFLVLVGNRFWFYIHMYLEYNTVVVLC